MGAPLIIIVQDVRSFCSHINYAKSSRLYLQTMEKLPKTKPWLYDHFIKGYYTDRRANKKWTGIWSDLAIEQNLMRSLKTKGGLTVGHYHQHGLR